ncbi:MAG TPA: sulfotransferase [Gaiellaceae bacterium]|nr:sulfotransferase [Gaiellaceae bacterium]
MTPPVIILGVGRSGTTLLRVMLDRNSQLAVPYESFFVPQLARRHGGRPRLDAFLDDLRRLRTLREWGLSAEDVRPRLRPGMTTGEAIAAVFEAYAERRGKPRWGDKTPLYMQHLPLLERLFPDAWWVHLVRDGRDAALSFLELPPGFSGRTWAQPRTVAQFAARWRTEVEAARRLGRRAGARYLELRYEDLVAAPERELRRVSEHASLPWEPAMLDFAGTSDVARMPEHRHLAQPPTPGLRDWRRQMSREDALAFERVAGDVLRSAGYELLEPEAHHPTLRGRWQLARFATLSRSWNAAAALYQRSPLWGRAHPPLDAERQATTR